MRPLRHSATGAKQRERAGSDEVPPSRGAWYPDPFGKAAERWWDGSKWTQEVRGAPTGFTAGPVPTGRSVSRSRNAAPSTGAHQAKAGTSRVCRRCYGTGEVTYDTGITGKCPSCMGKGRTTPEDRRANLILTAIGIAILIAVFVLPHVHL
jgi:hypothetical protein